MTADDFIADPVLGREPQSIDVIIAKWDSHGYRLKDDATGMATMLTVLGIDAVVGDGLINEIPPELQSAMQHLMGEKADTYDEARELIQEKLANGSASFDGFVSKIKGQIGEDRFVQEYPDYVLATSKSQEGVDALTYLSGGVVEATQVKMYADADGVIKHMLKVQEKVSNGLTVEGDPIGKLNFAVPENILPEVREKMGYHPELAGINLLPIDSTANEVAGVVREAGSNIGNPIEHLATDVLESVAFMAALDTLANTYLVAKGKKSVTAVVQEAMLKTPIGAIGIATSKSVALALTKSGLASNPIVIPLIVAVATRRMSQKWFDRRVQFAQRLRDDGEWATLLTTAIANRSNIALQA